jgi:L-threonylcarbamoyladenylate synthase
MSSIVSSHSPDAVLRAVSVLNAGGLVGLPTETVYGLAARADNDDAVAKIFQAKGRPTGHPLILHISDISELDRYAVNVPSVAMRLAEQCWPGPLTLLLHKSSAVSHLVTGGRETVALRMPANNCALEIIARCGHAVAAPSANRFGHVSPTNADAVQEDIGAYLAPQDLILDGGPAQVGLESTIIDCTGDAPKILRPGAITQAMIEEVTGLRVSKDKDSPIRVSGSLEKHYAPNAKIILDVQASEGQGFIAPSDVATPSGAIRLASPANTDEYARTLYSALRDGDAQALATIAIIQPSGDGLAIAIRDRLMRASRGR